MADLIPAVLTAGITKNFDVLLTAYPASSWQATLHLRGPQVIDINANENGAAHRFSLSPALTTSWAAGKYWYSLRVNDGTDTLEVESGEIGVAADLAAIDEVYDGRGHAQKVLDAIEAVIENRATRDQQHYKINNRELTRTPIADLLKLRARYKEEVRKTKAAARGQSLLGRVVKVTF